jgi:DNA-nicking Smr family endonuclease
VARLSAEESALWQLVVREVAPLRRHMQRQTRSDRGRPARPALLPSPAPEIEAGGTQAVRQTPALRQMPARSPRPMPVPPLDGFAGVDRATAEKVRRGRYPVAARLDLHGLTQSEAHRTLGGFIVRSRRAGSRCVLVITGHGRLSGGILKRAVPRWLAEPELREHILAIAPARPQDGGDGALYVLLRRLPA